MDCNLLLAPFVWIDGSAGRYFRERTYVLSPIAAALLGRNQNDKQGKIRETKEKVFASLSIEAQLLTIDCHCSPTVISVNI